MAESNILTKRQQALLRSLAAEEDLAREYVLSGGTALAAFYLRHRLSDDCDFFTMQRVDYDRVIRFMEECKDALHGESLHWQKLYDRHIFQLTFPDGDTLKTEFTLFPYPHLEPPLERDGILIDTLRDIAAGKLVALLDRNEPKDYYDVYFLVTEGHASLSDMRRDVATKFDRKIDPLHLGSELEHGVHFPAIPHLLKTVNQHDVQQFFGDLAKTLRSEVIE